MSEIKQSEWLDNAIFYEIYPQSFQDSNGDGIGDFQGIISRLDYIKGLGCNAIWMNPCFDSPFGDAGYDVSDYYKAAPRYGTNEDLKNLFNEVHKRNMHILLDLVPGHTSTQHKWFLESIKAEKNEYTEIVGRNNKHYYLDKKNPENVKVSALYTPYVFGAPAGSEITYYVIKGSERIEWDKLTYSDLDFNKSYTVYAEIKCDGYANYTTSCPIHVYKNDVSILINKSWLEKYIYLMGQVSNPYKSISFITDNVIVLKSAIFISIV